MEHPEIFRTRDGHASRIYDTGRRRAVTRADLTPPRPRRWDLWAPCLWPVAVGAALGLLVAGWVLHLAW